MDHVDAGHHLEQLTCHMGRSSHARRPYADFAGIGLGVGDELGDLFGWNRRVHHDDVAPANDAGDWRDVVDKIEIELFLKRRADRVRRTD
jgi:hypothetical protein